MEALCGHLGRPAARSAHEALRRRLYPPSSTFWRDMHLYLLEFDRRGHKTHVMSCQTLESILPETGNIAYFRSCFEIPTSTKAHAHVESEFDFVDLPGSPDIMPLSDIFFIQKPARPEEPMQFQLRSFDPLLPCFQCPTFLQMFWKDQLRGTHAIVQSSLLGSPDIALCEGILKRTGSGAPIHASIGRFDPPPQRLGPYAHLTLTLGSQLRGAHKVDMWPTLQACFPGVQT